MLKLHLLLLKNAMCLAVFGLNTSSESLTKYGAQERQSEVRTPDTFFFFWGGGGSGSNYQNHWISMRVSQLAFFWSGWPLYLPSTRSLLWSIEPHSALQLNPIHLIATSCMQMNQWTQISEERHICLLTTRLLALYGNVTSLHSTRQRPIAFGFTSSGIATIEVTEGQLLVSRGGEDLTTFTYWVWEDWALPEHIKHWILHKLARNWMVPSN